MRGRKFHRLAGKAMEDGDFNEILQSEWTCTHVPKTGHAKHPCGAARRMANLGREFIFFVGSRGDMSAEIWEQLVHGKPLDRADLPKIDGRIDVRNLHIAEPYATKTMRMPRWDVTFLGGITTIRGVTWRSIDFSSSQLPGLRLFDCQVEDCVFDKCRMADLRVWGTSFLNVSFRSADLRDAALGGVHEGRRNSFRNVDFTGADLRGTAHFAAEFVNCKFKNTKAE